MHRDGQGQKGYDLLFQKSGDRGRKGRTLFRHTTVVFSLIYLVFLLPDRMPLPYYGALLSLNGLYTLLVLIVYGEKRGKRLPYFPVLIINLLPFASLVLLYFANRSRMVLFYNEIALSLIIIAATQFLGDKKLLFRTFFIVITLWVLVFVGGTLRYPRPGEAIPDSFTQIIFLIIAFSFSFFLSQYNLSLREGEIRSQKKKDAILELIEGEGKTGLFLLDTEQEIFLANGLFYRMTGGTEEKGIDAFTSLFPKDHRETLDALRRGDLTMFPLDLKIGKGDQEQWARMEGVLTEESGNRPVLLGTLTDISALKRSENRARNDASSIKALLMAGDIYLWKMTLPGRERLYLHTTLSGEDNDRDLIPYGQYRETIHPDFRDIMEEIYSGLERNETNRLEVDYLCSPERTDRYLWLRDVGFVSSRDGKGEPVEISGFTMDIDSDRREATRIDQALRASGFVPWQWDKREGITEFDEIYFDKLLPASGGSNRVSQAEFFREMVHPEDQERVEDFFKETLGARNGNTRIGRTLIFRVRFTRGSGYIWAEGRLTGVQYNRRGQPLLISGIVRDITQEKSRDLKLEEERKEREVADTKNRFFTTISHELLTPMNAFYGLSEQCSKTELNREQRELFSKMRNSYDLLLHRIHELLDISDLGQGGVGLIRESFSPSALLQGVSRKLTLSAQAQGLDLLIREDSPLPNQILGDRNRVEQIIVNLVRNGIKFTPRGKVILSAESLERSPDSCRLRFTVTDEGIGIPRDKLSSIFEPFGQVDSTMSRTRGGIGLSLAINKQLVELMGGRMEVSSIPGEGSTFYVELPFALPGTEKNTERKVCTYPGGRVLIIDDNPLNRDIAADILRLKEIETITAAGGLEGLELIKTRRPHLVFMDIQMPELDGYRTTRMIREQEKPGTHLPVVALTANITEKDREKAYSSGMDGFIAKPLDIRRIEEVLNRWLEEFCRSREEEQPTEEPAAPAIPGISMEETLERLGGEYEMLLALLSDYREDYLNFPDQMKELWKKGDHREIYGRIHALKGVSGSLGISDVYRLTEIMGSEYRGTGLFRLEDLESLEKKMDHFQGELALFLEGIKRSGRN